MKSTSCGGTQLKANESYPSAETSGHGFASIWLVVALSLCLNLYGIQWGLPNGIQDWANDSVAPLGPLVYAKRLIFQEPWTSKYPPFHYMVLGLVYAPYALYLYVTGGLTSPTDEYPYGFETPEVSLMVFTLIARLTSVVMGTGTVLVNYYTVRRLYDHRAGVIAAFLIASSYGIIYYAHNANIDVPLLFWTSLGLYTFVALLKTYETKYYVLFGLFMALALGTKESIYALFLGFGLLLLGFHIRHEQTAGEGRRFLFALWHRKLGYGILMFVIASILVFNLPFNWQGATKHVEIHLEKKGSVTGNLIIQESASVFHGHMALLGAYGSYLVRINGLPVFLLLMGGFLYCLLRFPSQSWIFLIPIVTHYLFYLSIHSTHHLRYILPVYLLLTWQAGKFAADLLSAKRVPRFLSIAAISLILAHSLVYGFSLDLLLMRDSRYAAETWMAQNIPKDASMVALGPGYGLPRFPPGVKVRHMPSRAWHVWELLAAIDDDYLVLNMDLPDRVSRQPHIYRWLEAREFYPVASFKSEVPLFDAGLFHVVNPKIVIFKDIRNQKSVIQSPTPE